MTATTMIPKATAKIHYDAKQKKLGIQYQDGATYSDTEYQPRIALRNVTTMKVQGFRDGCGSTGVLGYMQGEVIDHEKATIPFAQTTAIKWDGYDFKTDDNQPVKAIREVYVIGSTILGFGVQS